MPERAPDLTEDFSAPLLSLFDISFKQVSCESSDSTKTFEESALSTSFSKSSKDTHLRECNIGEEFPRADSSRSPLEDDERPDDFDALAATPFLLL